jgi:hypothetical protein
LKEQIVHLHVEAPPKPALGASCNGCGVCCALDTCPAARVRFRQARGPCPALEWSPDERCYRCGLLADPGRYLGWLPAAAVPLARRLMRRWIAAGKGCDCSADIQY